MTPEDVLKQLLIAINAAALAHDGDGAQSLTRAYADLLYTTQPQKPFGIDSAAALELRAIEQNGSNA